MESNSPQTIDDKGSTQPLELEHLHNVLKINELFYSGSSSDSEIGYQKLGALGIKTIISVDGANPEVELAHKYGMTYVHIPIGYDGFDPQTSATLSSILTERPGPYYLHCHHGKHRGPTALAHILVKSGTFSKTEALEFLEQAGLSKDYPGLWKCIEPSHTNISKDIKPLPLQETAATTDYVQAMVEIDKTYEEVKLLFKNKWQASSHSPDLSPAHSALILHEKLSELHRTTTYEFQDESDYQNYLKHSLQTSKQLETELRTSKLDKANSTFKLLKSSCFDCHAEYRN